MNNSRDECIPPGVQNKLILYYPPELVPVLVFRLIIECILQLLTASKLFVGNIKFST